MDSCIQDYRPSKKNQGLSDLSMFVLPWPVSQPAGSKEYCSNINEEASNYCIQLQLHFDLKKALVKKKNAF
jgi:hypothetical protein